MALNIPDVMLARLDPLANWVRSNSLWPMPFATACCGIELMATGRLLSFEEGQALDIINEVYEGDDATFMSRVVDFARGFTPPNKASRAVGAIKRAVQTGAEIPFETALALERELQQQLFQSADAKEGLAAYIEKRTAEFKGK